MNTYDLTFSCSEVILSGGSAKVKADSLDEAKEKLEQALRAMDKSTEEVSYNYEYNNEYCDNSFQVDSIEEKEHKENGTEPFRLSPSRRNRRQPSIHTPSHWRRNSM